jgi:HEAT repeat protein
MVVFVNIGYGCYLRYDGWITEMKNETQHKGKGKRFFLTLIILFIVTLSYFYWRQDDYEKFFTQESAPRIQDQSMPSDVGCQIKMNWHKGARQLYRLDIVKIDQTYPSALEGQVEDHDNYALQMHMEIRCILNMRVFEKTDDIVYIGCQLSNVNVRAGEFSDSLLRDKDLEAMFRPFFLIAMYTNGLPKQFYFPPHLNTQSRTSLSEIIYAVQTVVPDNNRSQVKKWRSREQHALGTFKVEYMLEPHSCRALIKQNIRCTGLNEIDQAILKTDHFQFRGIIEQSNHQITLSDDDASWIESYAGEETFEIFVSQHALWYRLQTKILLSPDRQQLDPKLFIWETNMPVREIIDSFASNGHEKKKESRIKSKNKFSERLSLASQLEMFQKDILENASQDVVLDHISSLEQFLTKYPEEAGFIPDLIKNLNLQGRTAENIILILEMIGHESAQSAISDIFLDYNQLPDIRMKAIVSAGGIASPNPILIDRLFQLISQGQESSDTQGLNRTDEAILSLGLINKALYKANNSVSANFIHNRLIRMLQNASDERNMIACIKALGNSAMPKGTDYLLPFMTSNVSLIRKSAIQALGKIESQPKETSDFSDDDQEPQIETAQSSSKSLSDSVSNKLFTLFYNEDDPEIRKVIIQSIISRNEPESKDVLEEILQEESDEKIVDMIHSYLQLN